MLFNKARALAYMRQCGLDALVATSPVNITYFTDYHFWLDPLFKDYWMSPGASSNLAQNYAIFPLEGEPALIIGGQQAGNAADLWVRDLHTYGDPGLDETYPPAALPGEAERIYDVLHAPERLPTATAALAAVLQARGLLGARLGVELEGLTAPARAALPEALPGAQWKDCSNLLRLIRAVKSAEEIARLERAAEISEQAGLESLALARPGVPMADIVQHYRAAIAVQGADFDHFAYSYRGMGVVTEPDYRLAADDVLFVDWGCNYKHYFSDTGTTLAVRDLPPMLAGRHAALRAMLAAGLDSIWPGVRCSAVHAALRETLAARGITAVNPHGHGLGLEVRDYPILVADNGLRLRDDCIDVASDLPLEAGMVFNLECAIFMPGVGTTHLERSFVVAPDGARPLTPQDRSRAYPPGGCMTNYVTKPIPAEKPAALHVERPWGAFEQYATNQEVTVSLMTVQPGQRLSLQAHTGRAELWIALDEGAVVQIGEQTLHPRQGEELWIPPNTPHRLSAVERPVRVLEVAFGNWQQADITRFADDYARQPDGE